jgi:hypothetical protein
MRIRWLTGILALLSASGSLMAQPVKAPAPTVEVRLQSVNVLLDKAEYVAGLAGKEDVVQGVKLILKNLQAQGKGIEGIDPKRPFGLYANLHTDVIASPVTAMVPITDQDRFLGMLKERLDITPEKVEGGALKVDLPEGIKNPVLGAVYLRFANDYLYVARSAMDLEPTSLIEPKAFFSKDDEAVASLLVRGDGIPKEVKTFIIGQFELAVAEHRKKKGNHQDPAEKIILDWLGDGLSGGLKTILDDAKELSVRVLIDPKEDELSAQIVLTPKTGTPLAGYIASLANNTSLSAGIVSANESVASGSVKIALTPDLKASFVKVVDEAIASLTKKAKGPEKEAVERALNTLAPTLKAAELDLAVALIGPDGKGHHTFLAALAVKNGKEIEKLAKDFAPFAGAQADFAFDIEKIGGFSLHKVVLSHVPEDVEKIFGTKTVWVAVSDSHIVISMESNGTTIRDSLRARAVSVPVLSGTVSLAKLLPLLAKDLKPDEVKALLKDAFGDGGVRGKDSVTLTVKGGEQLSATAKVKGKGVRLLFSANLLQSK